MAAIRNTSNVDIVDRPVNSRVYSISAGKTITGLPRPDADALLEIYGFLTEVPDTEKEVKAEVKETKVDITSNNEAVEVVFNELDPVTVDEVVEPAKTRTRRSK